ncbi:MAG: protein kinase [Planctomycetota bacterium]
MSDAGERDIVADLYAELLDARWSGARPDLQSFLERCPEDRRQELEEAIAFVDRAGLWPGGPPSRLGELEIRGEIGRGGMGIVFEAYQPSLDRRVALKLIAPWLPRDAGTLERLQREAVAVARLQHPSIVPVYEAGEADGHRYLAMELVEGVGLDVRLVRAREGSEVLPVRKLLTWFLQIASALATAHRGGVVHRDVKPSNVLIGKDQKARLLDFGLARIADQAGLSATGFRGSPHYAAPEQVRGDEVGPAGDLYSLGVLMYEAFTGRVPFEGDSTMRILHAVVHEEPAPPRRVNPRIARDIETVILRCLEKDPARRYASAEALEHDLEAVLELRPITARRASRLDRAWKWMRRNRAATLATAIAVLAVLVMAGVFIGQQMSVSSQAERWRRSGEAAVLRDDIDAALSAFERAAALRPEGADLVRRRAEIESMKRDREAAALRAERRRADGMRLVYQARIELERDPTLGLLLAIEAAERAPGELANDTLRAALAELRQIGARPLGEGVVEARAAADGFACFTESGRVIVEISEDRAHEMPGPFERWSVDPGSGRVAMATGSDIEVVSASGMKKSFSWSEEVTALALGDDILGVVDAAGFIGVRSVTNDLMAADCVPVDSTIVALAAKTGRLAGATEDGRVVVWSTESGTIQAEWEAHSDGIAELRFLGEDRLVTRGWDRRVCTWQALNGTLVSEIAEHRDDVRCSAVDVAREWLVTGCDDGVLRWWRDGQVEELGSFGTWITALALSEAWLVAGTRDGRILTWNLETGSAPVEVRRGGGMVLGLRVSGDRTVSSIDSDGKVERWSIGRSTEPIILEGHEAEIYAMETREDLLLVATAAKDQTIRIWDRLDGRPVAKIDCPAGVNDLIWNGKELTFTVQGEVRVWYPSLEQDARVADISDREPARLAPRPDSRGFVSAQDETISLFSDGALDRQLTGFDETLVGRPIAIEHGKLWTAVPVWRTQRMPVWAFGKDSEPTLLTGHRDRIVAAAAAPFGPTLATASWDGTVRIWNADTGETTHVHSIGDVQATSVTFSPSGGYLAAGASDGSVRVWRNSTRELVWEAKAHDAAVSRLAFTPDSEYLVTAGGDEARIWLADDGEPHSTLEGHRGTILALCVEEDHILTASADGTARIWVLDPSSSARRSRPRELTPEERERFDIE